MEFVELSLFSYSFVLFVSFVVKKTNAIRTTLSDIHDRLLLFDPTQGVPGWAGDA